MNLHCCRACCTREGAGFNATGEGFYTAKWQTNQPALKSRYIYAAIRIAMAMYLLAWYPVAFTVIEPELFFIYFTDWGYTLILLDAVVQAILAVLYCRKSYLQEEDLQRSQATALCKISWVITNFCSATSVTVTAGYWIIIYPNLDKPLPLAPDIHLHLLNSVYVLISVFISKRPFKLGHYYFPLLHLCLYLLFSYIYWLCGGKNGLGDEFIYPFLNFRDLKLLFGFGALLIVVTLISHGCLCLVDSAGKKVFNRNLDNDDANYESGPARFDDMSRL